MEQVKQDLDIKDFQAISSAQKLDSILMVLSNGLGAKVTIDLLIKILLRDIQPSINEAGEWVIGTNLTGQIAVGKSPFLQTSENGIEWKYDDETSFRPLVSYDQLKLKFTDMTPEQIQMLVGGKGDTGDTGGVGPTGETGKSAYAIAAENGYTGTEQQFGEEQSAIADNSARLASVETGKANLINGTISPDEISPLLGRQTGISLKGNSYYERETTSDIENNFGSGNFSLEYYLNYDLSPSDIKSTFNMFAIRDQNNRDTLAFYRQYTGAISVYLNSRREDNSYEQLGLTFRMPKGINHVILTMDRINKTLTGYSNGVKFGSVNFKESVSYTTKEFIIIGDKSASNGAQPFIAKHLRAFNYILSERDVDMLYNFGHPEDFNLDYQRNSISVNRCVYEFLPYGITLNTWRDTIKGLNLTGKGLIENRILNYEKQSLSSLAPLFIARGAVFNNSTGFYELNGLIDITESQMISIYNSGYSSVGYTPFLYKSSLFRTNLPPHDGVLDTGGGSILAYFEGCAFLEVARCDCNATAITRAFNGCIRLRSIITPKTRFLILNCNTAESTRLAFKDCHLLEDVLLDGLNVSISFADSPNLKRECIVYVINKSTNTSPITITLHATAKARLTEEDIALAVSKNITIA